MKGGLPKDKEKPQSLPQSFLSNLFMNIAKHVFDLKLNKYIAIHLESNDKVASLTLVLQRSILFTFKHS